MTIRCSDRISISPQRKRRKISYHKVCPFIRLIIKNYMSGTFTLLCGTIFQDLLESDDSKVLVLELKIFRIIVLKLVIVII